MKLINNYDRDLEEIYVSFKLKKYNEIVYKFNCLINEQEKLSYNTLYKFITKIYYTSTAERQNLEGFITYLNNLELETPNKQYYFKEFIDYFNLEISRFIEKDKIKEQENKLGILNVNISKLEKKLLKMDEDIRNSKLDIVGIVAGVLSLFTIFGADYSFLTNIVTKYNFDIFEFIMIWMIFNLILLYIIKNIIIFIKYDYLIVKKETTYYYSNDSMFEFVVENKLKKYTRKDLYMILFVFLILIVYEVIKKYYPNIISFICS